MANVTWEKGPQFVRYFQPVLDALNTLGGSGRPDEVVELIADSLGISEKEKDELISSGESRFRKNVNWARFYLAKAEYIDASTRGVWTLTETGRKIKFDPESALRLFNDIHKRFSKTGSRKSKTQREVEDEIETAEDVNHRASLLNILQGLPADGFERICQRLLRESGFETVTVTGRTGDGGLDGIGILQVNPFVSFKVLFQCKRYSGVVNVSQVRDFRGAMMGRADKGIILTTGTFTSDARKEAVRDGVPPIELVDGEKIIDMFEELQLGLTPKKAYDVNLKFLRNLNEYLFPPYPSAPLRRGTSPKIRNEESK